MKSKYLGFCNLDYVKPTINEVIGFIKSSLKDKKNFIGFALYEKKDGSQFNYNNERGVDENRKNKDKDSNNNDIEKINNLETNQSTTEFEEINVLKKYFGIAEFKTIEAAVEVFEKLNDINIYDLTFDIRFLPEDHQHLLNQLKMVDYEFYEDLFALDYDDPNINVDEYISSENLNDSNDENSKKFDFKLLLKDFIDTKEDVNQKKVKNKQIEFIPNLNDDRFKEFYTDSNYAIDKTSQAYQKNKKIDIFVDEKIKREDEMQSD